VTDIASLYLKVDSTQVDGGAKSLDQLAQSGGKAEASTTALTSATNILANAARIAAGAFGAFKLVQYAREATLLAARYETMGIVMKVAGNNAGYNSAQMDKYSKALQKNGISMLQSRDALTQLATANIDLAKASEIGRAAQDLAVVGNVNSSEAMNRMIHGIKSGQIEVLRTLGLNVSFEESYKNLAAELHKNVDALNAEEKALARTNAVLSEAKNYAGIYEESMTTAGKAMSSLIRYSENLKIKLGEVFLPALASAVFGYTDALKAANQEADDLAQKNAIGKFAEGLLVSIVALTAATATYAGVVASQMIVSLASAATSWVTLNIAHGQALAMNLALAKAEQARIAAMIESTAAQVPAIVSELRYVMAMESSAATTETANAMTAQRIALQARLAGIEEANVIAETHLAAATARTAEAQALASASGSIWTKTLFGTSVAANVASGALSKVGLALNVLMAAFVGWEIGTWLTTFEEVRIVGQLMIGQFLLGFEHLKFGAQVAGAAIAALVPGSEAFASAYARISSAHDKEVAKIKEQTQAFAEMETHQKNASKYTEEDAIKRGNAARAQADADDKAAVAADKAQKAYAAQQQSINSIIDSLEKEAATYGMTAEQVRIYEAAMKGANFEEITRIKAAADAVTALKAEEEATKAISKAQTEATKAGSRAREEAIRAEKAAQASFWSSIERTAHDTFVSIMDGGKDAATRLRDTFKNIFFDWLYQMTIKKWIVNVSGVVGTSSAGAANAGGIGSLFTGGSGGIGGIATGGLLASGALGTFGTGIASAMATGVTAGFTNGIAAIGLGQTAAGLGMMVPMIGAAVGGALVLSKLFKHRGGPGLQNTGGATMSFDSGGGVTSSTGGAFGVTNVAAQNTINDLQNQYSSTAASLGITQRATSYHFGQNQLTDGSNKKFRLAGGGYDTGEIAQTEEALQNAASRAIFSALQGSEMPSYLRSLFDSVVVATASSEDLSSVLQYAATLKQVRDALTETRSPLELFRANVADGLSNVGATAETFKQDFIAAIDAGMAPAQLAQWQQLGMAIDQLAQVDAQAATEAAAQASALAKTNLGYQQQIDVLTGVQTQRQVELTNALEGADSSTAALITQLFGLQDAASAAQEAAALAQTNLGIQQQIDVLTGAQTQRQVELTNALAGADASTAALITQLFGLQDAASAAQAAEQELAAIAQAAGAIAQEHYGLETQLLQAQGDTTALRARELALLDPANRAIQEQIWAIQDKAVADAAAQEAAQAQAQAAQEAAQEAARAAEQIKSAWQSVTDLLFEEVARIRGLNGAGSTASAQSQFAIATAQARAGDQEAAKLLPQLSQALIAASEATATSAYELAITRGRIAGSLATTALGLAGQHGLELPSFSVGSDYVPYNMVAQIHKGERIIPAATNDEMVGELRALRQEVASLRASSDQTATATRKTSDLLRNVTQDGNSLLTTAA